MSPSFPMLHSLQADPEKTPKKSTSQFFPSEIFHI
jgi:hypothetical protein